MKIISAKCPSCGAGVSIKEGERLHKCEYCYTNFMIDDETLHVKYDNAEEAGYQFEKGRQRAQAENAVDAQFSVPSQQATIAQGQPPKKRKTWLWVLGWIFIFPAPLTVLMLRNGKLDKKIRYAIIAIAWVLYLVIAISGQNTSGANNNTAVQDSSSNSAIVQPSDEQSADSANSKEAQLDTFIQNYNSNASMKFDLQGRFNPADKEGEYYRTEYRLSAWNDSAGAHGAIGSASVDFVAYRDGVRMYASCKDKEDLIAIFTDAVNIYCSDTDKKEREAFVNETVASFKEGYYPSITFEKLNGYLYSSELMIERW